MSSSVYFKFKSQKEPSRVTFDGTGISVYNLKREIINIMKLGDGTDFELALYNEETNEEYDDDLVDIPRATFVVARRLPAIRPGKGGASRYVSGKPPVNARAPPVHAPSKKSGKTLDMNTAQTEEERVKAMFSLNDEQWRKKQQEMANETRVPFGGNKNFQKKTNVPEGEPPHGYICYRCGKKGHWIQACPTNDDPNFEGKTRLKRTTGIPRSMLKTIDQSELDKLDESQRQNMMINADGQYVLAQADEKEWKKHQDKVKASAAAQEKAETGDKEIQDRGLECPIDKCLFVDPMKTPCCGKTYCNECITNALIESDLTCPSCETENIIMEDLTPDEDMKEKIKAYQAEKAGERHQQRSKRSSSPQSPATPSADAGSAASNRSHSKSPTSSPADSTTNLKKRSAEEGPDEKLKATGAAPALKRQKSNDTQRSGDKPASPSANDLPTNNLLLNQVMPPDMSTMMQTMPLPNMNFPMPGMPMTMPAMPFMPMPGMMNGGMMANFMPPNMGPMGGMNGMNGMNGLNGINGMNGMTFPNAQNGFFMPSFNNSMMANGNGFGGPGNNNNMYSNQGNQQQPQQPPQMNGINGIPQGPRNSQNQNYPTGPSNPGNKFSNQQRHQGNEEDNAYMRQPVNPHRHQNRPRRARPSEYREL